MGQIDARLAALFGQVKPGVALPIIVVTVGDPASVLGEVRAAGGGGARVLSPLGHAIGAVASEDTARRIASLESVRVVGYDEPVTGLNVGGPAARAVNSFTFGR